MIIGIDLDNTIINNSSKPIINMNFMDYDLENKFNTIFGNPPYLKYNKEWTLNTNYPSCNMYVYFIEKR